MKITFSWENSFTELWIDMVDYINIWYRYTLGLVARLNPIRMYLPLYHISNVDLLVLGRCNEKGPHSAHYIHTRDVASTDIR